MGKYGLTFAEFTTATGYKTAFKIAPASNRDAEVVEVVMTGGGVTTPADTAHEASVTFLSSGTAGTSTSQTPEEFNWGSQAAGSGVTVLYSSEPATYRGVNVLLWGFNQRGGMRYAVPRGEGIIVSAAASASGRYLGGRVRSHTAGKISGHAHFHEP